MAVTFRSASERLTGNATQLLRLIIGEVRVSRHEVQIDIMTEEFRKLAELPDGICTEKSSATQSLTLPVQLKRRGAEARLILQADRAPSQNRDQNLIRPIAKAHVWFEQVKMGERKSIEEIATAEKINAGDVSRALPLAFLAPSIIEAILEGKQPVDLTAERLRRMTPLPHSWAEQKRTLGFQLIPSLFLNPDAYPAGIGSRMALSPPDHSCGKARKYGQK